jgi:uncharacterized protein
MLGELTAEQIEAMLRAEITGRIGCHADGRTYVVPVTYAYESGCVYSHSLDGLKLRLMRQNPQVCFEIDRVRDLGNWQSVVALGYFEELRGDEAIVAMDLLIARFAPLAQRLEHHPSYVLRALQRESLIAGKSVMLYRIRLAEKSGRFERT